MYQEIWKQGLLKVFVSIKWSLRCTPIILVVLLGYCVTQCTILTPWASGIETSSSASSSSSALVSSAVSLLLRLEDNEMYYFTFYLELVFLFYFYTCHQDLCPFNPLFPTPTTHYNFWSQICSIVVMLLRVNEW
jgi:hypothetical protein